MKHYNKLSLISLISGPILALIAFAIVYVWDPSDNTLSFAFFLSVIILLISQIVIIYSEVKKIL